MIFNDHEITPQVISTKDFLLRHAAHKKEQQILKDLTGNGPDLRVLFCKDDEELLIMGYINE